VNPEETEAGRLSEERFLASVVRIEPAGGSEGPIEGAEQEERQHLWQYLLAAMAVVLAAESLVAARTS
jgi:hypothetical protein